MDDLIHRETRPPLTWNNRDDAEQLKSGKKFTEKEEHFTNGALNSSTNGARVEDGPTAVRNDSIEPV